MGPHTCSTALTWWCLHGMWFVTQKFNFGRPLCPCGRRKLVKARKTTRKLPSKQTVRWIIVDWQQRVYLEMVPRESAAKTVQSSTAAHMVLYVVSNRSKVTHLLSNCVCLWIMVVCSRFRTVGIYRQLKLTPHAHWGLITLDPIDTGVNTACNSTLQ